MLSKHTNRKKTGRKWKWGRISLLTIRHLILEKWQRGDRMCQTSCARSLCAFYQKTKNKTTLQVNKPPQATRNRMGLPSLEVHYLILHIYSTSCAMLLDKKKENPNFFCLNYWPTLCALATVPYIHTFILHGVTDLSWVVLCLKRVTGDFITRRRLFCRVEPSAQQTNPFSQQWRENALLWRNETPEYRVSAAQWL